MSIMLFMGYFTPIKKLYLKLQNKRMEEYTKQREF